LGCPADEAIQCKFYVYLVYEFMISNSDDDDDDDDDDADDDDDNLLHIFSFLSAEMFLYNWQLWCGDDIGVDEREMPRHCFLSYRAINT